MNITTWKMAWHLLTRGERRAALLVLGVVVIAAFFSAGMVASIMPFLTVLGDPSAIQTQETLAWFYDRFGFSTTYSFLVALGLASLCVILCASLVQVLRVYAVSRFSMMRMHSLSFRLLETYLRQPYAFFRDRHTGEMGTQILAESQQVVTQFFRPAANVVASLLSVVVMVGVLFWVNPFVTLASFAILGAIYGGAYYLSRRKLSRLGDVRHKANKARFRIATEALGGIKDVKLLNRERSYLERFEKPSHDMARTQVIATVVGEVPSYVLQGLALGGMIVLGLVLIDPIGVDTGATLGGVLPLLGVFAFAGQRLIPELQRLYHGMTQIQFGGAAVRAIHADMFAHDTNDHFPKQRPTPLGLRHDITLDGITYRFPKADHAGLMDVMLTIRAGEKIGVVGGTGAGKTTLADLLLGLNRPQIGTFRVDGVEITDANVRAWQQSVGYVPQDIFLIDASIKANIALGLAEGAIDLDRVRSACRIAQLDTFIETELSLGYETLVGECGVKLSGGQRQRIGIARALYHNASFFVFDEATSALDNVTEQEVMAAINGLPGDKTILIIAHRLSTVKACDTILVLDQGRVVGQGGWDDLLSTNATFKRLAQTAAHAVNDHP